MSVLTQPLRMARMMNILREVDLGALKDDAEKRFYIAIQGDETLSKQLAETLSHTPGYSGIHPYIGFELQEHTDLRIVIGRDLDVAPMPERQARKTITLCVSEKRRPQVGLELPRTGEDARIFLSGLTDESVQTRIIPGILNVVSEQLALSLARHLPAFRPLVLRQLIEETSNANALYAAGTGIAEVIPGLNIPLNVADTFVLTKNQLIMAYKIALAAGKNSAPQHLIAEIVSVLGGGLLFRQVARGLVGLIPVWGVVPKVGVAYAGTQVIGTATVIWATQGREASALELRQQYSQAMQQGLAFARRLLGRGKDASKSAKQLPAAAAADNPEDDAAPGA